MSANVLTKQIWSRRTDKKILMWVVGVLGAFYLATGFIGFVSARWFTASGRKQTQELIERAQELRTAPELLRGKLRSGSPSVESFITTAADFRLEYRGDSLVLRAVFCRSLELRDQRLDPSQRDRWNALTKKECDLYEQEAKSLRDELKITPTFRF